MGICQGHDIIFIDYANSIQGYGTRTFNNSYGVIMLIEYVRTRVAGVR